MSFIGVPPFVLPGYFRVVKLKPYNKYLDDTITPTELMGFAQQSELSHLLSINRVYRVGRNVRRTFLTKELYHAAGGAFLLTALFTGHW